MFLGGEGSYKLHKVVVPIGMSDSWPRLAYISELTVCFWGVRDHTNYTRSLFPK